MDMQVCKGWQVVLGWQQTPRVDTGIQLIFIRTYCIFEWFRKNYTVVKILRLKLLKLWSHNKIWKQTAASGITTSNLFTEKQSCVTVGAVFGMFHHSLGCQGFQTLRSKLLEASATIAPNNALLFSKFADARGKILHGYFFRRRTSG